MLLSLFLTVAATAVTLERDGAAVSHGEVCRFRAAAAENPIDRWLSSGDLACVPVQEPIEFPPGSWNVFARSDDAVSIEPRLVDSRNAPASLAISLQAAAFITTELEPETHGAIYVPAHGAAYPLRSGPNRLHVPAGVGLWLFVLGKNGSRMLTIGELQRGTTHAVDVRSGGGDDVVGWIHVPAADREALAEATDLARPVVQAAFEGTTRTAEGLPRLDALNGALFRIRGVPTGDAELSIGGRRWLVHRRPIRSSGGLTLVAEPLLARAAGTLIVNVAAEGNVVELERSLGSCEKQDKPPEFVVTISSCVPPSRGQSAACSAVRTDAFESIPAAVTLEDVVPGWYRAEMRYGVLPPVSAMTRVPVAGQQEVRVVASYFEIYGSVTHGGEPIGKDAAIEFPQGYGFATGEKSEYRAALRRVLHVDEVVSVEACHTSLAGMVFIDRPVRRNARFNIDIPANELTIRVTDTFTREPLGGANIRYAIFSLLGREVTNRTIAANQEGAAMIHGLPQRQVSITVTHPGYEKGSVERFTLWRDEKRDMEVQLVPLRGSRGRIISSRPFEQAAIFWYSAGGMETERADLSPDGTFVHANAHEAGETMIVVSLSHPLWALRTPRLERHQTFQLRFPDAAGRHFDIWVTGADRSETRIVGVVIGDVRIPPPVLRQHQFLRAQSWVIDGGGPLLIRDVLETGPIDVLLGPLVTEVPSRLGGMDLFALPQYAEVPRRRLAPGAPAIAIDAPLP